MRLTSADRERLRALFEREEVLRAELRAVLREQCEAMRVLLGRGVRLLDVARVAAPALGRPRDVVELARVRTRLRKRLQRARSPDYTGRHGDAASRNSPR